MPLVIKSKELISRTASLLKSKYAKIGIELIEAFKILKAY